MAEGNSPSNLVARLRGAHPHSPQYINGSMILAEAADEIERLGGALAYAQNCDQRQVAEIERLTRELRRERALEEDISQFRVDGGEKLLAERDRLREALEDLAADASDSGCLACDRTARKAREALSGEPKPDEMTAKVWPDGTTKLLGCDCFMCEYHRSAERIERERRAAQKASGEPT